MNNRTSRAVVVLVAAVLMMTGLPARAAEPVSIPAGGQTAEHPAPKKAPPALPAPRRARVDPDGCQPAQDIACTVVRETAQGTLIVTMRRTGPAARPPAWIVVSGVPPTAGAHPGGTVYVVPNGPAEPPHADREAAVIAPNGAPILD